MPALGHLRGHPRRKTYTKTIFDAPGDPKMNFDKYSLHIDAMNTLNTVHMLMSDLACGHFEAASFLNEVDQTPEPFLPGQKQHDKNSESTCPKEIK